MPDPISVLVVDDSALMRNLISRMVDAAPGMRTVDKAMNGVFALQKIPKCHPDVIILDIEMPEMNGIEFLKERKRLGIDIPVIILSSIARSGAQVTMEALALGASDFITKPSGSVSSDIHTVAGELTRMIAAYGSQYQRDKGKEALRYSFEAPERMFEAAPAIVPRVETKGTKPAHKPERMVEPAKPVPPRPARSPATTEIVAIGISTGGPNALRDVFARISPALACPIVVVQHMPAGFTEEFAASLNRICPLEVKEAADGDLLKPGRVLIAPGDWHVVVEKKPLASVVRINQDPAENGHRPSADVLFRSVAREYGNKALAVIMTGMGKDGARELGSVYLEGGITLGQDEESSVVYGMPKVAYEMGHVMEQVPLAKMAERISSLVAEKR
ncbi:MAG: chemotaxis response regulator protein-glutamate methylesterase [Spirochaetales bacterium]|nr:chemotaxis response regulator protein-glutamate methylesterase [Spirochaetales bacterium]